MDKFVYVIVASDTDLQDFASYVKSAFPEQFADGTPSFPIVGRRIGVHDESKRNEIIGVYKTLWETPDNPACRLVLDGLAKDIIGKTDPKFLATIYSYKWSVVEGPGGSKAWVIAVYEL